jgi:2-polyprenyl-6-methoxyphenol hydroxylase-like FAD-dependent oxidoreductase
MAKTSVLIAGAGPVGLTLANELTRYGIPVRIVDTAASRTDKSKALVLWSRSLELLDQAGYIQPFLAAGMPAHGAQVSNGKELVARVTLDGIKSRYPYALMIPQSDTERILEEHLEQLGVKVERSVTLESFGDGDTNVASILRKANGEKETVEADWLAGCDGAHSTVRHGLGLEFEGTTQPSDWYLADGHFTGLEPHDVMHIYWHRDGILAFFPIGDGPIGDGPIGDGRWRVIADLGPAKDGGRHADPTLDDIQALIRHRSGQPLVIKDAYWLAAFRINERKVSHYGKGHAFLVGDAAHIHSPAGGQGMNTGMQDAFNLAWKLALVIQGGCKPSLLDSYSKERSAVGDMVLRNASVLTDAAVMRNPIAQGLRNAVVRFASGFPFVQERAANTLSETDIHYPDSPLSVAAGSRSDPKAGMRWPDRLPMDSGKPRFLAFGPRDATRHLAEKFPALVQTGPEGPDLKLIRPDGYVGFAGSASDRTAAEAYLLALAR